MVQNNLWYCKSDCQRVLLIKSSTSGGTTTATAPSRSRSWASPPRTATASDRRLPPGALPSVAAGAGLGQRPPGGHVQQVLDAAEPCEPGLHGRRVALPLARAHPLRLRQLQVAGGHHALAAAVVVHPVYTVTTVWGPVTVAKQWHDLLEEPA
eukprot:766177-Hanusia_phi.AAC.1